MTVSTTMTPSSSMNNNSSIQDRSLLILIIDLNPSTWNHRQNSRNFRDRERHAAKKSSLGPATLTMDVLPSLTTFLLAYAACHRENALVILGCAGYDVAVLYPRKGVGMERMVSGDVCSEGGIGKVHPVEMEESLKLGVAELMELCVGGINNGHEGGIEDDNNKHTQCPSTAAIASATSQALCIINRFLRNSRMSSSNRGDGKDISSLSLLSRDNQEGILSMIAANSSSLSSSSKRSKKGNSGSRTKKGYSPGSISPRILILQASEDRMSDYNAFMNCVFAASKLSVTIDGCFIPSGSLKQPESSVFLEQACDRTGGVYTRPVKKSQISGGLAEIFLTVFLPPIGIRDDLNLLKVTKVDFRARCFETGERVEMGVVCSLCLSIFSNEPAGGVCLTCGGTIEEAIEDEEEEEGEKASGGGGDEIERAKRVKVT